MRESRSLLLKPMPPERKARERPIILKRLVLVSVLAAIAFFEILLVRSGFLSKQGIGYWFYAIHDYLYLPVKGYTYTLFHPWSLLWWGATATLLLLGLTAYVASRSFLEKPHVAMLRWALQRGRFHPWLVSGARWLKRIGIRPHLLLAVASHERQKRLARLTRVPLQRSPGTLCGELTGLTLLALDLDSLPPISLRTELKDIRLRAAECYYETVSQFRLRLHFCPRDSDLRTGFLTLIERSEPVLKPLFNYRFEPKRLRVLEKPGGVNRRSVVLDLACLASLDHEPIAACLFKGLDTVLEDKAKRREMVWQRLAETTSQRLDLLDRIRHLLEAAAMRGVVPGGRARCESLIAELPRDPRELRLWAKLALGLSIEISAWSETVDPALAVMDGLEALDFILETLDPGGDGALAELTSRARWLVKELPSPGEYRICAELMASRIARERDAWNASPLAKKGPVHIRDFELAETRVQALYHAAGPDFEPLTGEAP